MCVECVEAVNRVLPGWPEAEAMDVLISMTAFPFNHGAAMERQLWTARKAITQGRHLCMYCGRARARKHMDGDFCKKPCKKKWEGKP